MRANIDSALLQAWDSGGFGLPYRVADLPLMEPVTHTVLSGPGGNPWARVTVLPARPTVASLGSSGDDEIDGIMQADLFYPLGQGPGAANAKADDIAAVFGAGKTHSYNGVNVHCDYCGRISQLVTEDWLQTIVEVGFHSWIQR